MRRMVKVVLFVLGGLFIAVIAVPFLVPVKSLQSVVTEQMKAATGRDITLDDISFSIFPNIALKVTNVKLGNPAWAGTGDMADIKGLRLGVELIPLLHKQVRITNLTLESPHIALIKNGDRTNWDFSPTSSAARQTGNKTPDSSSLPSLFPPLSQLKRRYNL